MALVRDIYPMEELGRRFATVTMIVLVAPLVAPTLGSLLLPIGWWFIFIFKALYALVLLIMYVFLIGETRPGTWRDLSISALFVQCKEVVARRVDGSVVPIRYAISMALSAAVLMTFVTNASIIYLQFFDLSPTAFPIVFGVSVVGFMSMNLFSMKRLTTGNAGKFFRVGLKIQIVGAVGLFLLVVLGFTSIWIIVPVLAVTVATLGLVGPAGSARYMSFFTGLAGSASSVYTTMMFSFGGVFGWLAGRFYDGSLLPIVSVMLAVSIAANLVALTIPNRTLVAPTVI
jgi:DHA1 family bicyclomycin/chloramphenicol resistance-like MFS transporter